MKAKIHCPSVVSLVLRAALVGLALFTAISWGEPFQPVTVADPSFGVAAGGDNDSSVPLVSADGRYVLFASAANNLVLFGGSNALPVFSPAVMNLYVRDRMNGTTTLVTPNLAGFGGGNCDSIPTGISTNGQFVLFESFSSNLVAGVTNFTTHVYLRDTVNNTTALVSTNLINYGAAQNSVMTPDGRYVAFMSFSTVSNLGISDVFVRDMQNAVTTKITPGGTLNGSSDLPDITPDGHYVAYCTATNPVAGARTMREIYIRDLIGGTTIQASGYAHTIVSNLYNSTNVISFSHSISDNGQHVAYEAANYSSMTNGVILRYNTMTGLTDVVATNAAGGQIGSELSTRNLDATPDGRFIAYIQNTNSSRCICVWDAQTGVATLASGNTLNSVPANSTCAVPAIDASGRYVTFAFTGSAGLTSNTVMAGAHIYLRDMQLGITTLVDADTNGIGSASNPNTFARISDAGGCIAYEATGAALVANGANQYVDIYLYGITNQSTELISLRRPELPSTGLGRPNAFTSYASSTNGRYFAFSSESTNVAHSDTNSTRDVFVRDLSLGSNTLVSVSTNGVSPANGASLDPAISSTGQFVSFTSYATNLTAGLTNLGANIFSRDLQAGVTVLASVNTNGTGGGLATPSYSSTVSADGRRVFFHSQAPNLAPGVSVSGVDNVFVRDLLNGATTALVTNVSTVWSAAGGMTPDGHFAVGVATNVNLCVWNLQTTNITFTSTTAKSATFAGISSDGTHIGAVVFGTTGHVYAINTASNTTVAISPSPVAFSSREGLRFSGDSRYLVYTGADSSKINQIFTYDFQTGSNALVSRNFTAALAAGGNANSDSPDISADGRFVAYRSVATNLVVGITNGVSNIYLYDRVSGITTLANVSQYGNFPAAVRNPTPLFSGDGHTLFLKSWAQDLSAQGFSEWAGIYSLSLIATNSQSPFPLTVAANSAAQFTITWPAVAARTYQVQYKTNLSDAQWTVLNGDVTILGTQATVTDYNAPTQRYYRVVAF